MKATYKDKQFVIPVEIGDTIMVGKFRNKPVKVKEIGIDDEKLIKHIFLCLDARTQSSVCF